MKDGGRKTILKTGGRPSSEEKNYPPLENTLMIGFGIRLHSVNVNLLTKTHMVVLLCY